VENALSERAIRAENIAESAESKRLLLEGEINGTISLFFVKIFEIYGKK
jgi:hypothetical protein